MEKGRAFLDQAKDSGNKYNGKRKYFPLKYWAGWSGGYSGHKIEKNENS
ncbi:MAG: hypothetical protein AAFX53_08115 [Bacteroidota bacterium]